nr:LysE family transporter [Zoogloea sp. LCSB751]
MPVSALATFWAVSFLFVVTPGVDWAYAISAGLHGRVVVPAVTGLLIGHLLATFMVAAGVGGLVASSPSTLTALMVGGASYLLWLGVNMLRGSTLLLRRLKHRHRGCIGRSRAPV